MTEWSEAKGRACALARSGLGDPAMRRCEKCGSNDALSVHHRRKRSQLTVGLHRPSNLVVLCLACHEWAEHNATEAKVAGWVLGPRDDPTVVAIQHAPMGMRVRLDDDGNLIPVHA